MRRITETKPGFDNIDPLDLGPLNNDGPSKSSSAADGIAVKAVRLLVDDHLEILTAILGQDAVDKLKAFAGGDDTAVKESCRRRVFGPETATSKNKSHDQLAKFASQLR